MPLPTRQALEQQLSALQASLNDAASNFDQRLKTLRDNIIEKAEEHGLDCEELDEFLEANDLEPRGSNWVVWVPVIVRADGEEGALESLNDFIPHDLRTAHDPAVGITSEPFVDVGHARVEVYDPTENLDHSNVPS